MFVQGLNTTIMLHCCLQRDEVCRGGPPMLLSTLTDMLYRQVPGYRAQRGGTAVSHTLPSSVPHVLCCTMIAGPVQFHEAPRGGPMDLYIDTLDGVTVSTRSTGAQHHYYAVNEMETAPQQPSGAPMSQSRCRTR